MRITYTFVALFCAIPAFAQRYEVGLHGGISSYDKKTVTNPQNGDVDAGFNAGWAAGFTVGHNMYEHVGGEIRYTFLENQMKLEGGSTRAKFDAQAHAIHYDVLLHATDTYSAIRPYVAFGGGVKMFRGTGEEQPFQPLSNVAILTKTTETKPMVSVGGGIKVKATDRMWLRFDVHDYLTPFPTKVITPNEGSSAAGWFNNFVATGGISFTF